MCDTMAKQLLTSEDTVGEFQRSYKIAKITQCCEKVLASILISSVFVCVSYGIVSEMEKQNLR